MKTEDIVSIVSSLPRSKEDLRDIAYWEKVVPSFERVVLDQIVTAYDWDFTMNDYSSEVTVADQADYEIKGKNTDCRDIISIRYGSKNIVLSKVRTLDADEMLQNNPSGSDVVAWYQSKRSSKGFPVVTLFKTPTVAGEILYIRYRYKSIPLSRFPEEFSHVVAYGVLSWVNPAYLPVFEAQIRKMVKRHNVGGKDYNPVTIDPHITMTNRRNAALSSGGGAKVVDS